jgi:hypothetical protein
MRLNRDALVYRLRGQGFPVAPRGPRGDYPGAHPAQLRQPARRRAAGGAGAPDRANARAADADATSPLGQWRQRLAQARPEAAAASSAPGGKSRRKRRRWAADAARLSPRPRQRVGRGLGHLEQVVAVGVVEGLVLATDLSTVSSL